MSEENIAPEDGENVDEGIGEYHGKRNSDGERHGFAWAILPNKDIYRGYYLKGLRQGKGLYVFRNGARYEGLYRKGVKYGFGKMIYPDGSKYEGEWKNDYMHGFGAYYYPNNDIYEGGWYKGKRHGLGTYIYFKLQTTFMGSWVNGIKEGPGQLIYSGYRFHGSWSQNNPLGPGVFTFESGCMQKGLYEFEKKEVFEMDGLGSEPEHEGMTKEIPQGDDPVWRPIKVMPYSTESLPPQPMPFPIEDSLPSISDQPFYNSSSFIFEPSSHEDSDEEEYDTWLGHDLESLLRMQDG